MTNFQFQTSNSDFSHVEKEISELVEQYNVPQIVVDGETNKDGLFQANYISFGKKGGVHYNINITFSNDIPPKRREDISVTIVNMDEKSDLYKDLHKKFTQLDKLYGQKS